ncbi:MAG: hypothetical protein K2Y32_03740 [Candidatus Obscuribacterales bacterium]|nr:hypothetical protein [Candidatus Obscuribacterales bacterium]
MFWSIRKRELHFDVYAICFLSMFLWQSNAQAELVSYPYDWMVEIKSKPLIRQFQFSGSQLKQVEKLDIHYHPAKDSETKTQYEYLWYSKGKALGLEKNRKFDLPEGEGVAIRVTHSAVPTEGEKKACAGGILRVALDAFLNKNPVVQVRLPHSSFNEIANRLEELGMQVAPDSPDDFSGGYSSNLTLYLYSEPDGLKRVLYR